MSRAPRITDPLVTPKGPVDPTCSFWPKGQCERPYREKDACWNCGREVVRNLRDTIRGLKEGINRA